MKCNIGRGSISWWMGCDTLRPAVFTGTWIGSHVSFFPVNVGRGRLTWIPGRQHSCHGREDRLSSSLRGLPQALSLSGGARFIARRQWCLVLEEYRLSPRHFREYRPYMGNGPATGPIFKKRLCATLIRLVGRATNTWTESHDGSLFGAFVLDLWINSLTDAAKLIYVNA